MLADWPQMITSVFGSLNVASEEPEGTDKLRSMWNRSLFGKDTDASLTKSDKELPEYTLDEVAEHCHYSDCWIVIYDKVYDVTQFIHEHPGGDYIIGENCGRDATMAFRVSGHSKQAHDMLEKYCIGRLVESQRIYSS